MSGRREATKARTRAAIIEAGIRLMAQHGYESTPTAAIAREAGVSTATLFNYFPTKASIVFADDNLWAPPTDSSGAMDPALVVGTPRETLLRILQALLDQPNWTRPADDPLTAARFELVRREPSLRQAQIAQGFAAVPAFAAACQSLHPGLEDEAALAEAGSVVGAVLAAVTWARSDNLRVTVNGVIEQLRNP